MRCELDIEKHLWVTASMWNMLQPQCDCIKVSFSVDCLSRSAIARCLTVSVPVSPALHPLRMSVNPTTRSYFWSHGSGHSREIGRRTPVHGWTCQERTESGIPWQNGITRRLPWIRLFGSMSAEGMEPATSTLMSLFLTTSTAMFTHSSKLWQLSCADCLLIYICVRGCECGIPDYISIHTWHFHFSRQTVQGGM